MTAPLRAASLIRDIPDFPQPGILFKDITPVLQDPAALKEVTDAIAAYARQQSVEVVVGIESRGFIFGVPVALTLGVGFVPVRKAGKLPYLTHREEYSLEYGTNVVEIHQDAITPGQRVLVVDDLLATGGTARAAARLIERVGGEVAGLSFLIELSFLEGRKQLDGYEVQSLITY